LGVIRDPITDFGLEISVHFLPTAENTADYLTRTAKQWLGRYGTGSANIHVTAALSTEETVEATIEAGTCPNI